MDTISTISNWFERIEAFCEKMQKEGRLLVPNPDAVKTLSSAKEEDRK